MRRWFVAVTLALLLAAACDAGTPATSVAPSSTTSKASVTTVVDDAVTTTTLGPGQTVPTTLPFVDTALELQVVADGFEQPVFFTEHDGTYYVVDQPGVIWGMAPGGDPSVYLDLGDRVRFGGEQGLLGLAFHPEHADILYVNYTGHDGRTVVSEFTGADAESERIVLEIAQPAGNHNGGMIAFGPLGDLWVGTGDGGAADDKFGNGQNEHTLLGAMLRLTVGPSIETTGSGQNRIFAAPEVAAIGLRNPWRFSFDYENVWIADVGQGDVEEINRVSVEGFDDNFGWPLYEG
ncbi:MAG: PQQ-dependent sugar dehydrogenase, partial [Actinomycetota bacterium]